MENTASSSGWCGFFFVASIFPTCSLTAAWSQQSGVKLGAAIFHLAAPGALGERVTPRRWINIGISVAVLIFAALALGYFFDALALY